MGSLHTLKQWSCTENEIPSVDSIKHIHVYDFDNTLFRSPLPNRQVWSSVSVGMLQSQDTFAGGGWWHDPNILKATGEGIEKEEPRAWKGWWNEQVVQLVELSMQQKDALTVLLTGRSRQRGFPDVIQRIIKSRNLQFDLVVLKREAGPANQKLTSTMKFKQCFLEDLINTYSAADEVKLYEDRVKHVQQFREFFQAIETSLRSSPKSHRKPFRSDVVEIVEETKTLDPLTEVMEIQKMINTHNTAFAAGTLPRNAKPWEIKKNVMYTAYLIKPEDTSRLLAVARLPNRHPENGIEGEYRTMANNIMITTRPCPSHISDKVGGLGRNLRWRTLSIGNFDSKVFAIRVEPVPHTEKIHTETTIPMVVLALKGNGKPFEANRIQHWMPLKPEEAIEFDTEVGEKVILRIEVEQSQTMQTSAPTSGYNRSRPMDEEFPALGPGRGTGESSRIRGGNLQQGQKREYHGRDDRENRRPNPAADRGGKAKYDNRGGNTQRGGGPGGSNRGGNQRGRGGTGHSRGGRVGGQGAYRPMDDEAARSNVDDRGLAY